MSMGSKGDATSVVNDAIDTPFDGTQFFDALFANEEYLAIYHGYLKQLAEEYVDNGRFDEVYTRIRSQIDDLVADDPTAFYSYEEYDTAAKTLNAVVHLRAQSIEGQLNGSIPSTDEGQKQDPSALIDASDIDIDSMGEFNMGGAKDGGPRHQRSKDASNENRPNFAGMQEQQEGSGLKTWLLYGGCMAVMLTALIILWNIRRRKHR